MKYTLGVLIFFVCLSLHGQNITMATVDWSPFYGRDLPKQGFIAEIARQGFKRLGHDLTINFMPWKRAMLLAKKGHVHGLFGCWISDEMKQVYHVSNEIMGSGDGHFLAPLDSPLKELVPEKLLGLRVGIIRGYPISEELSQLFASGQVIQNDVNKVAQLLDMIGMRQRIDIILENYQVAKYHYQKHHPNQAFNLKVVGKDYVDSGLYVCWTREMKGIKKLAHEFDEILRNMRKEGRINTIKRDFGIL